MAKKDKKSKKEIKTPVTAVLDQAKFVHISKGEEYGPLAYLKHGKVMDSLFPDGIKIKGEDAFNLFALVDLIVVKINRISHSMEKEPHLDSFMDLTTYSAMATSVAQGINHESKVLESMLYEEEEFEGGESE